MNKHLVIALVACGSIMVGMTTTAEARDPTKSRWYRGTQWVGPVYKRIDRATRAPIRDKRFKAFKYGWKAGKYLERKGRLGDRLYNRFERRNQK